jgi:hypothetical protein
MSCGSTSAIDAEQWNVVLGDQTGGVQQGAVPADGDHEIGPFDELGQRHDAHAARHVRGRGVLRRQHFEVPRQQLRHQRLGAFGNPRVLELADEDAGAYRHVHGACGPWDVRRSAVFILSAVVAWLKLCGHARTCHIVGSHPWPAVLDEASRRWLARL